MSQPTTTQQFAVPSFRRQIPSTDELGSRATDNFITTVHHPVIGVSAQATTLAPPINHSNFVPVLPHHMTSQATPTQQLTQAESTHRSYNHAMRRVIRKLICTIMLMFDL